MGNYATSTQLIARFEDTAAVAHLTNSTDGSPVTAVLDEAIANAEGTIDGYLSARYEVPVDVSGDTNLAATLKGAALDISVVYLHGSSDHVSEIKKKLYDDRLAWLKMIAEGKINLPSAAELPSGTTSGSVSSWGCNDADDDSQRIFSRERLRSL